MAFIGFIENSNNKSKINFIKIITLAILSIILLLDNPSNAFVGILTLVYLIISTIKLMQLGKKKLIVLLWGILIIFAMLFIIFCIIFPSGIRLDINRIIISYNPEIDSNGLGWKGMEQKAIIHSANFFGKIDYGNTSIEIFNQQAYNYTLIALLANYGWILSIAMVVVILVFHIKLVMDSSKIKDNYGKLLMLGISCLFILRSIFCILMNLNLGIKANFSIPFVSYEQNSFIIDMISLAIIFSIYRKKDITTMLVND